MSANALSKALGVPVNRITAILHGQRGHHRGHRRCGWRGISGCAQGNLPQLSQGRRYGIWRPPHRAITSARRSQR